MYKNRSVLLPSIVPCADGDVRCQRPVTPAADRRRMLLLLLLAVLLTAGGVPATIAKEALLQLPVFPLLLLSVFLLLLMAVFLLPDARRYIHLMASAFEYLPMMK